MTNRDGHVRVLPLHVANKIAAGEVVERPASVVKELVENAIDAGAKTVKIAITAGGRKLVAVQDDGCGMTRDDAVLSLERQATSKIRDVSDIEEIDTLGFRGEAIPSIASVSRFTITTRRHDSDEGTLVLVNAGILAEVRAAGCPPGTLVEVRDLFCNVPARRKFLRAYVTEENHVKTIFTVHALAHPEIGFTLVVDGRELYRLAPAASAKDRILDLFGKDFVAELLPLNGGEDARRETRDARRTLDERQKAIRVTGFIERPNLSTPTRRDQYVFINGRPATAPSIAYALREAYPRQSGDTRPAAILFVDLPPNQVDVNVHPTKREVRFRDNVAVKQAIVAAVEDALHVGSPSVAPTLQAQAIDVPQPAADNQRPSIATEQPTIANGQSTIVNDQPSIVNNQPTMTKSQSTIGNCQSFMANRAASSVPAPAPVPLEFAIEPGSTQSKPWQWFKFLAQSASGYLLIETDAGIVTINPHAARERIAFEKLLSYSNNRTPEQSINRSIDQSNISQTLLIPETVRLSPPDFARVKASLPAIESMGFQLEEFGTDTFKVDAVPQLIGSLSPATILSTIARDLAESSSRRGGERWREELIAKSVARSFAGAKMTLTEDGAVKLIEELCACRMPYVCPRGKRVMIFTSTRELDRKFERV